MMGHRHVDLYRFAGTNLNGFVTNLGVSPLALKFVLQPIARRAHVLYIQVLIVCPGVSDTPSNICIVSEVRKRRASRERQPYDIEIWTGDLVLVIDVGSVQASMRITGD